MKVVFLPAAEQDIQAIYSYIHNDLQNPAAARNIATKLLLRTQTLADFPKIGTNLHTLDARFGEYRFIIVDNYLLIYNVTDSRVRIVRILYARSDYLQLLQG